MKGWSQKGKYKAKDDFRKEKENKNAEQDKQGSLLRNALMSVS